MSQNENPDVEAWLLRPWNATFCLWAAVWLCMLVGGLIDSSRTIHVDSEWFVGLYWFMWVAGLPLSFVAGQAAELLPHFAPVVQFLVLWSAFAAGSFVFWLVLLPFFFRVVVSRGRSA